MNTAHTPIRLLVVDDHSLFRRGLIALLAQDSRLLVVGEAGDANQALNVAQRLQPDLILLDNHLPGVRGVDAVADLKRAVAGVRVLMLTVSENVEDMAAVCVRGLMVTCSRPSIQKTFVTRSAKFGMVIRWLAPR